MSTTIERRCDICHRTLTDHYRYFKIETTPIFNGNSSDKLEVTSMHEGSGPFIKPQSYDVCIRCFHDIEKVLRGRIAIKGGYHV